MIVADTSYLVEGLLRDASLLQEDTLSPELALYEVANTVWKHEFILRDLKNSWRYLEVFLQLVSEGKVLLVTPDKEILQEAHELSGRYRTSVYDTVFVALALDLGLELKTFDNAQTRIFSKETGQRTTR